MIASKRFAAQGQSVIFQRRNTNVVETPDRFWEVTASLCKDSRICPKAVSHFACTLTSCNQNGNCHTMRLSWLHTYKVHTYTTRKIKQDIFSFIYQFFFQQKAIEMLCFYLSYALCYVLPYIMPLSYASIFVMPYAMPLFMLFLMICLTLCFYSYMAANETMVLQRSSVKFLIWSTSQSQYFNDQTLKYRFWNRFQTKNFSTLPHI